MGYTLMHGDVNEVLTNDYLFPFDSFDACFCDPPYLLSFMNRSFDSQHRKETGANEGQRMQAWHERWARNVYRVLKPGAFLLAFGGTRTVHRLTSALEDVGFEIRDTLCWLQGQGFPKSLDISKAIDRQSWGDGITITAPASDQSALWSGYGTALKPAHEPLILAMKPLDGTFAENALRWGVAGMDIDASRVSPRNDGDYNHPGNSRVGEAGNTWNSGNSGYTNTNQKPPNSLGRWPSNLLLSHHPSCIPLRCEGVGEGASWECHPLCPVRMLDEQSGESRSGTQTSPNPRAGGASRFFYTAKVSPAERDLNLPPGTCKHPTLKPITLTTYLAQLLLPPPRSPSLSSPAPARSILIPFAGAGSEMIGALQAGWDDVFGIEMEEESVEWARARIGSGTDVRETI